MPPQPAGNRSTGKLDYDTLASQMRSLPLNMQAHTCRILRPEGIQLSFIGILRRAAVNFALAHTCQTRARMLRFILFLNFEIIRSFVEVVPEVRAAGAQISAF